MASLTTTGTSSTVTRARLGSTRVPSVATTPSTFTRPSAMNTSHARREPKPARASNFWSRSPAGGSGVGVVVETRLQVRRDRVGAVVTVGALVDGFLVERRGRFARESQPALE